MDTNEARYNEEARMSNDERMTKWQMSNSLAAAIAILYGRQIAANQLSSFKVLSLIRHSDFGFRHFNEFVSIRG
jgi:hypothetical protein